MTSELEVCIIGGGIVGASTAFYLTHPSDSDQLLPSKVTIVDCLGIAQCASGYSGGFMAKDWHGASTSSLANHSFRLHSELAEKYQGAHNWGYRKLSALSLKLIHQSTDSKKGEKSDLKSMNPEWLESCLKVTETSQIGNEDTCAQVHPRLLTEFLIKSCECSKGPNKTEFKVIKATAKSIQWESISDKSNHDLKSSTSLHRRGRLIALDQDNQEIQINFDELVLAAGPWSGVLAKQLFSPELNRRLKSIDGMRAHSIVLRSRKPISPHALFTHLFITDHQAAKPQWTEPEFYPRPDNTVYICGAGDDEPLPPRPADVKVDTTAIFKLKSHAKAVIDPEFLVDSDQEVIPTLAEQACYLPVGQPLVGRLSPGVVVGTGLGCWGITLGPGTGHVLASMILKDSSTVSSADLSQLSPI
ncbi:FAD dependent oxidoreductase [Melampsora americana]|nr:FAD dependent oxidoreductase [Melampsora americana]